MEIFSGKCLLDNTMKHVANFSLKCDNNVVNMFENVLILRRHIVKLFDSGPLYLQVI